MRLQRQTPFHVHLLNRVTTLLFEMALVAGNLHNLHVTRKVPCTTQSLDSKSVIDTAGWAGAVSLARPC